MAFGAVLKGDKRLLRKIEQLRAASQRKIMRPAIRRGLSPINKEAKRRAPVKSGALKKALGTKVTTTRRKEILGMVGVRKGDQYDGDPARYAHLVEYGHGGKNPAPAHPFLRPALDAKRGEAFQVIATTAKARLKTEARKR